MKFLTKKMMIIATIIVAGIIVPSSTASADDANVLKVWARTNYFSPALLKSFEEQTGFKVVVDVESTGVNYGENIYRNVSDYDVIVTPANLLTQLIQKEAVQRIDYGNIQNAHNLGTGALQFMAFYNPDRERQLRFYAMPFVFGFNGFGVHEGAARRAGVSTTIQTLADFFDPEKLSQYRECGVAMNASPNELLRLAMLHMDADPRSTDPAVIEAAAEQFKNIRPFITQFAVSDITEELGSGKVCFALTWSGNVLKANTVSNRLNGGNGGDVKFTLPPEGTMIWVDTLAIPANLTDTSKADAFISFVLDAENAARVARYAMYPSLNAAANLINRDRGLFSNEQVFPDWSDLGNVIGVPPHDVATLERVAIAWQKVRDSQ